MKKTIRTDMHRAVCRTALALGLIPTDAVDETTRWDSADGRLDANETYAIARAFEHVESRVYDIKYPALVGRDLIPTALEQIGEYADTVTYYTWTDVGMADFYDAMSGELPTVDGYATEESSPIRPIGTSYRYTDEDVMKAARAVRPLPVTKALAARRAIELKIDYVLAYGDTARGIPGALNNANVPDFTSSITGDWETATPTEILADFQVMISGIASQSKQIHQCTQIVLPTTKYGLLNSRPRSDSSDTTVLSWLRANFPGIRITTWHKLEGIGAGSTDRVWFGEINAENLDRVITMEFTQLPPQARDFAFTVPCKAKIGGTRIRYPLSQGYADGV